MKRLLMAFTFAAVTLIAFFSMHPAWSDMIEIRGRGVFSGKIVSENDTEVTFKDDWGKTKTYPRQDVLLLEKTDDPPPVKKKAESEESGDQDKKSSKSKAGKGKSSDPEPKEKKFLKNFKFGSSEGKGEASNWASAVSQTVDDFAQKILDYTTGDSESAKEVVQDTLKDSDGLKNMFSNRGSANMGIVSGAIALLVIGALGLAIFGIQLIFAAFEEGFLWGFAIIGTNSAWVAPMVGGTIGLLFLIPQVMTGYFILTRWALVRRPIVYQMFSWNLILLGFFLFRIS